MSDAARFSTGNFLAAGFAYDAVSRRFVIGDALGQKLIVVGRGIRSRRGHGAQGLRGIR